VTDGRAGRRAFLFGGAGVVVLGALAGGGYELIEHGVLPGKTRLDEALGRTDVHEPNVTYRAPGPTVSGRFFSAARRTTVGWTISFPPGHHSGDRLPLVLALHGYTGNHDRPIGPVAPVRLLASSLSGRPLPAMAIAAIDGGNGYWHPHPGDDPMRMLLEEFLPMCRRRGLGVGAFRKIGLVGVSMGGYGSLLLAEEKPEMVAAVAAISPAVWTTYDESQNANPTAFTSATDFADHNVITHASALRGIPIRIASGRDDPFHPYVEALKPALPQGSRVFFPPGIHNDTFFGSQAVPSLAFIGKHLTADG
jgi:enterochelin esterase-like enzyme